MTLSCKFVKILAIQNRIYYTDELFGELQTLQANLFKILLPSLVAV